MSFEILDPTYDEIVVPLERADRFSRLAGATVGIISNGKQGTAAFFDEVERLLRDDHGVAEVVRVTKANYSAPADADTIDAARYWHAMICGIGD